MCEVLLQYIHINSTANIRIVVRCLYLVESDSLPSITQSAFRQVHSLFQSHFPTDCNLVLPLSIYGNSLHLLHLLSVTSILPSFFPSTACFIRHFLLYVWPIRISVLHFILCRIFLPSFTVCITSFPTRSI